MTRKAVIVFSGGQDSTTCLIHALPMYEEIHCITGVCETESSGYPDCGDEFIKVLNNAVCLGMDYKMRIETPLMRLNKAETWALASYHGRLDLIRYHTLTYYNGKIGSGCGDCDACVLRAKGLSEFLGNGTEVWNSLKIKMTI